MTLYSIVFLLTEVFFIYILSLYFDSFLGERRTSRLALFLTYVAFILIADGEYFLINNAILNLVLNLGFMFLITFHYESSYKKRVMMAFLFYVMQATIEMCVVALTTTVDISALHKNEYSEILGPVIIKFVLFIIVLLLRNLKNVKEDVAVPRPYWVSLFVIPIGSVYLIFIVIVNGVKYFGKVQIAISVTIILLINIVTFYLYDAVTRYYKDKMKNELLQRENLYYSQQFENIKAHVEEVSAFRHDFKNHLEVLDSLLGAESDEARKYISSITGVLGSGNQYSKTGNIPIDSIINYKLSKAQENQVDVKTEITIPKDLKTDPADMVAILGNLLDNAINATLKIEKDREIEFRMIYAKGVLQIVVTNTYNGVVKYENNRLKTTSGSEWYHGYGLRNVEVALKKYHGFQEVFHNEHIFRVIATMYI